MDRRRTYYAPAFGGDDLAERRVPRGRNDEKSSSRRVRWDRPHFLHSRNCLGMCIRRRLRWSLKHACKLPCRYLWPWAGSLHRDSLLDRDRYDANHSSDDQHGPGEPAVAAGHHRSRTGGPGVRARLCRLRGATAATTTAAGTGRAQTARAVVDGREVGLVLRDERGLDSVGRAVGCEAAECGIEKMSSAIDQEG